MRLVFIGSSKFGLRCLETCLGLTGVSVIGIVTAPQTFTINYRPSGVSNVLHADIAGLASSHGIPVVTLKHTMNEPGLFEAVAQWNPDIFLVAGWYHMIPKRWREISPAYGLHASLLPDYSGGAPLVWAMINGENKTGITLFQMDDGVDSGLIAGQKEEVIYPDDTIATLYGRIEERGLELLSEILPKLFNGSLKLRKQDEDKRHIMPQRSPEDGVIDWKQDAVYIDRFIRAQTRPYPGAFSVLDNKPIHIWHAQLCSTPKVNLPPGYVSRTEDGNYIVTCGRGAIRLHEITYERQGYNETELSDIFGYGGQQLYISLNCLKSS